MHGDPPPWSADSTVLELPPDTRLPEAGCILEVVALDGQHVCLARLESGELIGFESRCPHRGVSLCHAALQAGHIICLEHFWRWRVRGGEPLVEEHAPLRTYRVDGRGASLRLVTR